MRERAGIGGAAREHLAEAAIGLAVVLLAVWFVAMAWTRTGGGRAANAVEVNALFPNASGVNVGTDVRVAGLPIVGLLRQTDAALLGSLPDAIDPMDGLHATPAMIFIREIRWAMCRSTGRS